jgi:molybdopterin-containing oxidoreductase family membrane subunit
MYGVLFGRPYAFREGFFIWPWTFFLFIASAIASGPSFTLLVNKLVELMSGKRLVDDATKELMAKISGLLLSFYIFWKILDTWAWATGVLPKAGLTFDQMFYGLAYGKWLLWSELFFCGVIPAVMLVVPAIRKIHGLMYLAALLNCTGIVINRFVQTVQTSAHPVMPFDVWNVYIPSWAEWSTSLMIVAYGALLMSLSYRYLPIFPKEKELNS